MARGDDDETGGGSRGAGGEKEIAASVASPHLTVAIDATMPSPHVETPVSVITRMMSRTDSMRAASELVQDDEEDLEKMLQDHRPPCYLEKASWWSIAVFG